MSDEIGIHIRARANLSEVDAAARKLENFGGASKRVSSQVRQLVDSLKDSAGTDVNNLAQEIDKLQKKIQQPGISDKERKQAKGEIDDIRTKIKELKQLQKIKADDYGSMEQTARMYLDQLKNKRALTNAEKDHIKEVEKGLAYLEKYNKAKLDLEDAHLNKLQKDLQTQDEQAKRAGLGGAGQTIKQYGKQALGVVVGGSIVAVAVQAMKKWAEVDTAIVKTGASLDDMSKKSVEDLMGIGKAFGYTKSESLAFIETLTSISGKIDKDKFEETGMRKFLDWGRAMGVGPAALQMREIQRWGGEGVKPGAQEGQDKYFLTQFTAMARMMNMREGRMTEFIDTAIDLTKTMEKTFIKVDEQDIFRNILFPSMVFGGSDRGRGQRGLSFMQRLNEGMTGGGDLANLMLYRTIGLPKSWEQMWSLKKVREQGPFGTLEPGGEPLIMGLIKSFQDMFGGGARGMAAMKAAMPNMSAVEIEQMFKMEAGLKAGTWNLETGELKAKRKEELEAKGLKYGEFVNEQGETKKGFTGLGEKDMKTLLTIPEFTELWAGKSKVSAGERWKMQIESMQYSIGGIFGPTVIELMTGLARGVDAIATRFGEKYGYESQAALFDQIFGEYKKPLKNEMEGIDKRITEIDKIKELARGKKEGEKDYLAESSIKALEKEQEDLMVKKESPALQWVDKNLGWLANPLFPKQDEQKEQDNTVGADDPMGVFRNMVRGRGPHDYVSSSGNYEYRTSKNKAVEYLMSQYGNMTESDALGYLKNVEKAIIKDNQILDDANRIQKKQDEAYTAKANMESKSYLGGFADWWKMIKSTGEAKDLQAFTEIMKPSQPNITNNYNISIDGEKVGYHVNPVTKEVTITPPDYLPPRDNAN